MTRDEARELLGVDKSTPPDALRRAYARAVKKHKPERDPEGFRRVREAFELLSTPAFFVDEPSEPEVVSSAPGDGTDASAGGDENEVGGPSGVRIPPASLEGDPWSAEREVWVSRLAETVEPEARCDLLRDALARNPSSAELRWWLVDELGFFSERAGEAADLVREGERLGIAGFEGGVTSHLPMQATTDELLARVDSLPFFARWELVSRLLNREEVDRAVELSRRFSQASDADLWKVPTECAGVALRLVAEGRIEAAEELAKRLKASDVEAPRDVLRYARDPHLRVALEELLALRGAVSGDALATMARDLVDDGLTDVRRGRFGDWSRKHSFQARLDRWSMKRNAPHLARHFDGAEVDPYRNRGKGGGGSVPWIFVVLMIRGVFHLLNGVSDCGDEERQQAIARAARDEPRVEEARYGARAEVVAGPSDPDAGRFVTDPGVESPRLVEPSPVALELPTIERAGDDLCLLSTAGACAEARGLLDALHRADCGRVRTSLERLAAEASPSAPEGDPVTYALRALEQAADETCQAEEEP